MNDLVTDDEISVEVIRPGEHNTNAGPDFFNAQLRMNGTLWAGNVEIHIHSSDWHRHNHHNDVTYDSCILHIVYENDCATLRTDGSLIPTIELKSKYPTYLWDNYLQLIGTRGWIPCQPRIHEIDDITKKITIDKMIYERLEHRTKQIFISLKGVKDDWEECFYQHLAKNFGFQLNAMPFEMVARSLPLKFISKERGRLINIEALLFGQSGMLDGNFRDDYPNLLQQNYRHLANKYSLKNIPHSAWKYMRLRPVNFPSIRISQLSSLLYKNTSIFSQVKTISNLKDILSFFEIQSSEYWNTHFHFDKESNFQIKKLGKSSIYNLLINTCIPFLYAWGKFIGDNNQVDKAVSLLTKIPAEENHRITKWKELGLKVNSATDSQALIQLKMQHCSEKKCLTCCIGNKLINILP